MLEGCQIISPDWRYLYVNEAVAQHGRTTKEDLLGKTMMEMYPGFENTKAFSVLKMCMEKRVTATIENEFIYPDGKKGCFELRIHPLPEGIFILSIDITDRKKTENNLKTAFDDLSLVNEKLNVVGTLTRHDVRNKLAVIMGNLSIAQELLPPNHHVIKYLERTELAFEEIGRIFDRAHAYEHLGVDKLSYIDVKRSCDEAISLFHDLKGIQLVKKCERLTVYADLLLGQLFYNLIDNSLKHGKHVTKIKMYYEKEKDGLNLIYEDNGVGIPVANKVKIFGDQTEKGHGIGLHMVKVLCNIYGWSIKETGTEGQGVKFVISIPKRTKNEKKGFILSKNKRHNVNPE
jgi:PAS domain S-box-containing protein